MVVFKRSNGVRARQGVLAFDENRALAPFQAYFTPFSGFHEPCALRTNTICPM